MIEAVGASMSIPGLVPPVRLGGGLLVDGGVLNNLPIDHMAESGEGPVVAIDVIRRPDATRGGSPSLPTAETLARATVLASVERASGIASARPARRDPGRAGDRPARMVGARPCGRGGPARGDAYARDGRRRAAPRRARRARVGRLSAGERIELQGPKPTGT